jgi:hypothetical protein
MQIFINEASLHEQFRDRYQLFDSFKLFNSSIKRIGEIKEEKKILNSNYFFYYRGIEGEVFQSTLKNNPSLNEVFALNLQRLNPKSWQNEKKHEKNSTYLFEEEDFIETSVAEISERSIISNDFCGFLLNFSESKFGDEPSINILKNKINKIVVDCVVTPESIEAWLASKGIINPNEDYDESSGNAPADFQTVLKNSKVFIKTSYPRNKGRIVFRKIGTTQLWVVDSTLRHAGFKAHIEVFDEKTRLHLGTSLYNEDNLNTNFKKKNRKIELG